MVFDIRGVLLNDKLQNGQYLASCSATILSSSCSTNGNSGTCVSLSHSLLVGMYAEGSEQADVFDRK